MRGSRYTVLAPDTRRRLPQYLSEQEPRGRGHCFPGWAADATLNLVLPRGHGLARNVLAIRTHRLCQAGRIIEARFGHVRSRSRLRVIPSFGHIAFVVPDVAAALDAELAECGGVVGETVTLQTADGRRVTRVYVTDPEGNIVELQNWSDG